MIWWILGAGAVGFYLGGLAMSICRSAAIGDLKQALELEKEYHQNNVGIAAEQVKDLEADLSTLRQAILLCESDGGCRAYQALKTLPGKSTTEKPP